MIESEKQMKKLLDIKMNKWINEFITDGKLPSVIEESYIFALSFAAIYDGQRLGEMSLRLGDSLKRMIDFYDNDVSLEIKLLPEVIADYTALIMEELQKVNNQSIEEKE